MIDPLTLDQLRILRTVVTEGNFSAAARKLLRVQSAVSQSIRALEEQLGVELFDRSGRIPVLTDIGRAIVADATRVLDSVDSLRARADSSSRGLEPDLSITVDQMFPTSVLMGSLTKLASDYPNLLVTLFTEAVSAATQQWLRDGIVRLSIQPLFGDLAGLDTDYLVSIPTIPVAAVAHPLAHAPPLISNEELANHQQLVLADRTGVINSIAGGTASSPSTWRFADQHTRLEYLLNGFGWSHLPLQMAEPYLKNGQLKFLQLAFYGGGYAAIPLHVVYPQVRPPGIIGQALLADIRDRLALQPTVSSVLGYEVAELPAFIRRR